MLTHCMMRHCRSFLGLSGDERQEDTRPLLLAHSIALTGGTSIAYAAFHTSIIIDGMGGWDGDQERNRKRQRSEPERHGGWTDGKGRRHGVNPL